MTTKRESTSDRLTSKKLVALWEAGPPEEWRSFLEEIAPGNRWVVHGRSVKGNCPLGTHSDSTPSFTVDLQRGHAKCWSSACEYFGRNPVYFVKKIARCSTAEAVSKMKDHFGLKGFTKKIMEALEGYDKIQRVKQAIAEEARNVLIDTYSKPEVEDNAYARTAVDYLVKRGISPDLWHMLPIGALPSLEHFHTKYATTDLDLYKAIMAYLNESYRAGGTGWILFVNTRSATEIGRLRLRKPDVNDKKVYAMEDEFEDNVGLFGLNLYQTLFGHPVGKSAVVVEGEFDQLAIAVGQLQKGTLDRIVVSKGGKTNRDLSDLKSLGVETIYWVGDHDDAGLDEGLMLARYAPEELSFRHFQWLPTDPHKFDPDNAIGRDGFDAFYDAFMDPKRYLYSQQVCFQRADLRLKRVNNDDVAQREQIVLEHAKRYLQKEAERKEFFRLVEERHGIAQHDLLRDAMADDDTFAGFARRMSKLLSETYTVIGTRRDGGDRGMSVEIMFWNKEEADTRMLPIARPNDCVAQLAMDVGSLLDWCQEKIGIPQVMTHMFRKNPQTGEVMSIPLNLDIQQRNIQTALMEALRIMAGESQNVQGIRERSQGIHLLGAPDGIIEVGVLNGKEIYLGRYEKDGPKIEKLDNPLYRNNLFIPNVRAKWSACFTGDKIMEEAQAIDPMETFKDVRKMVTAGWSFVHQDIDATYCALLALILPYMSLFPGTLMTFISGSYMSGKTKLIRQFFSISADKMFGVVEPAFATDDYTVAGIRQQMNNAAMTLVLDEFEDKGNNSTRSRTVRELLTAFRSMIADQSVRTQGTVSGKAREYNLNFPILMAAAHPPRELADLSRVVMIVMQQRKDHMPPDQAILQKFDHAEIKALRRRISLALLPHVPEIIATYWQTKKELTTQTIMPAETDSRFKETVIPLIALARFLKLPWQKFAKELATAKRINEDEYVGVRSEGEIIIDAMLDTVLRLDVEAITGDYTLRNILSTDKRGRLNNMRLGVFIHQDANWLVIHWTHAESAILRNPRSIMEGQRTSAQLKALCDASEFSIPMNKAWPEIKDMGQLRGYSRKTLSVIDLEKVMGPYIPSAEELENVTEIDAAKKQRNTAPPQPIEGEEGATDE